MATFKPSVYNAERFNTKASILLESLTGHGKTGAALLIAKGLAGDWEKVGLTDTENRSANLYVGMTLSSGEKVDTFKKVDIEEADGYAPMHYLLSANDMASKGATVIINDSITHAWARTGGVLDMVNTVEQRTKNKYTAWGDPEVVKNKNALFEMLRSSRYHIISTVRVKEKFGMELNTQTGKNTVKSLGEQQQTQEGIKYEPDLVLHMEKPGSRTSHPVVRVVKTRYPMFELDEIYDLTPELIESMRKFLEEGADPDELLAAQRDEYVNGIMDYIKAYPNKKSIYDSLKNAMGLKDIPLKNMELKDVKDLYIQVTS